MGENEFELNGVVYVAVEESIDAKQCNGCAMKNDKHPFKCIGNSYEIPDCDPSFRIDGRNVIFVEKQQ